MSKFVRLRGGPEMALALRRKGVVKDKKKDTKKYLCRKNKGRRKYE